MKTFTRVDSKFKDEFFKYIDSAKSILITSHTNPDPDSMASVLLLYTQLKKSYPQKHIRIIYESENVYGWGYFQNFDKVEFVENILIELHTFDLLILVDGNTFNRFTKKEFIINNFKINTVCIDHHRSQPDKFDLELINPLATSTSEILYNLLLSDLKKIDKRAAELALFGILGDTGDLEFIDSTKSSIFPIVQRLVNEGGIDISFLKSKYAAYSERIFLVIQELTKNSHILKIPDWPQVMVSLYSKEFVLKNTLTDSELSQGGKIFIYLFGRSLIKVHWAFTVTPRSDGSVSLSLRSQLEGVNVRLFVENLGLKGGGHDRSAGGSFIPSQGENLDPNQCLDQIISWMRLHQPILV